MSAHSSRWGARATTLVVPSRASSRWGHAACVSALALCLCAAGSVRAGRDARQWQIVFVPKEEGPALWLEFTSARDGAQTLRRGEVAWLDSQEAWARSYADVATGVAVEEEGPVGPAQLPIQRDAWSGQGGALVTISAVPDWQSRVPAPAARARVLRARPRVASADSARLWLPPTSDLLGGRSQGAWLFGTHAAVEGFAWMAVRGVSVDARGAPLPDPGRLPWIFVRGREGLVERVLRRGDAREGSDAPFVAEVADACGAQIARVVSWPPQRPSTSGGPAQAAFRAVASPVSVCLSATRAITRVEGAWLPGADKEEGLVGVALWPGGHGATEGRN